MSPHTSFTFAHYITHVPLDITHISRDTSLASDITCHHIIHHIPPHHSSSHMTSLTSTSPGEEKKTSPTSYVRLHSHPTSRVTIVLPHHLSHVTTSFTFTHYIGHTPHHITHILHHISRRPISHLTSLTGLNSIHWSDRARGSGCRHH